MVIRIYRAASRLPLSSFEGNNAEVAQNKCRPLKDDGVSAERRSGSSEHFAGAAGLAVGTSCCEQYFNKTN